MPGELAEPFAPMFDCFAVAAEQDGLFRDVASVRHVIPRPVLAGMVAGIR
jgi:hypothetical protein